MATNSRNATFTFWAKPNFSKVVKTNKHYRGFYNSALLYAHYELSYSDLKKETVRYAKTHSLSTDIQTTLKDIPDVRFAVIGKYYYILNHGGELPDDVQSGLGAYLDEIVLTARKRAEKAEAEAAEPKLVLEPKVTVQDRIKERARQVAGEIDQWIDDIFTGADKTARAVGDFVALFKENDLKAVHMNHIQQYFLYSSSEITELVELKDKQLQEGYSNLSKAGVKTLLEFYANLNTACDMMREVAKVVRAPKVRKPASSDKLVAKLKFKKEDVTLGVVSITPTAIHGAKEVWVYNTKTRKINHYVADELQGPISIKGTSLTGFNEAKSRAKTLRKPKEQLENFKKSSKVQLRTYMKAITTVDTPALGRINEDCILLRADK